MADASPATPPAPAPADPVPPVKITVGQSLPAWARTALIVIGIVLIPLVGDAAYRHFHQADPTPPAPAVDATPHAVASGMYLAVQPNAPRAAPGAPIGMFRLDASASKSLGPIRWKVRGPASAVAPTTFDPAGKPRASIGELIVVEPGPYRFDAVATGTTDGLPDADVDSYSYEVPGATPAPAPTPGPQPPTPGPQPQPPAPPEPEKPAPIAGDGLRVLIVYESADLSKYPKDQLNVLYDRALRDHLAATCPKVNGTPEFRVYDKDVDTAAEADTWKAAMGREHPTLPWIVISNGKTGFEGPLPANAADTLALVKKYEVAK